MFVWRRCFVFGFALSVIKKESLSSGWPRKFEKLDTGKLAMNPQASIWLVLVVTKWNSGSSVHHTVWITGGPKPYIKRFRLHRGSCFGSLRLLVGDWCFAYRVRIHQSKRPASNRKCNYISLLFQVMWLAKCVPTMLQLKWFGDGKVKLKFVVKCSCRPQNFKTFHDWTTTATKCTGLK